MRDSCAYVAPSLRLKRVSYSGEPLLSIEQLRRQCEVVPDQVDTEGNEFHADDPLLEEYLASAIDMAEDFTGLAIAPGLVVGYLDAFPSGYIDVPIAPVSGVVSFVTAPGETDETEVPFTLDDTEQFPRLYPSPTWPAFTSTRNGVQVLLSVGPEQGTDDTVTAPSAILQALKMAVGDWYANREDSDKLPVRAEALLRPKRIRLGMA